MEEFKSNSHKSKEQLEKKVDKPVVSGARAKKKSEIRKFADIFVSEDVANVKSYIFLDVLIPAIKKAISDIVTNGIDMLLYGEAGRSKRNGTASKISYRSYYEKNDRDMRSPLRQNIGADFCDVEVDTRKDAEAILSAMDDIIATYGFVSVADMYDLADMEHSFTDNKYGWTDVRSASIVRTRNGYILKMPKRMPLD